MEKSRENFCYNCSLFPFFPFFFSFIKFFVSQLVISFPAHLYLNPTFSKFFFIYVLPLPGILSVKMLNLN